MTRSRNNHLGSDRHATTALEFALVFPVLLLFVFGLFAAYSLISARRAMDFGIERALRYAAVHSGAGVAPVKTAFANAAAIVWPDVGASATVTVSPAAYAVGSPVQVSVSYVWAAPAGIGGLYNTTLFTTVTLNAAASMTVMN